ncbi:hypothetical protein [uncultured Cellulomonas sp.]|uniref:hypothetical protein n=1 Tax=uncultured Cellulomonas sp. TaxID=189682 RepID=UPI0028E8F6E6|nr:hypothetical protein [uncultured Cellulomonas sp.]
MTGASLKAKFIPWHRAFAQVVGLGAGTGLWVAGTADAPPLGWQGTVAWVPFAVLTFLNVRWHREADRAAAVAGPAGKA